MAKQKRLFETALQEQQSCLEELRRALLQAEAKARQVYASEQYTQDFKREQVKKIAEAFGASAARCLQEAEQAQSELEAALEKSFAVDVPLEERTYNAARIGAAMQSVRSVNDLLRLYESEAVQSDAALRSELVRAAELHAFGKEQAWKDALRQSRPQAVKAAEAWKQKLSAFTGLAKIVSAEATDSGFQLERQAELLPLLSSFEKESQKALSEVE